MNAFMKRKIEQPLEQKLRQEIKVCYENAIREMDDCAAPELQYIKDNIGKKNSMLKNAKSIWVRDMALVYYAMYECIYKRGKEIGVTHKKALIAAIFYYVNPFDIIPDHIPGTGFIDDYYIAKCCIQKLTSKEKKLLQAHINKLR